VFKHTINYLKGKGHVVDLIINSKDVLEELIKNEGWQYTNIFPEGRKIEGYHPYIGAFINTFRTIFRIEKFLWKHKRYDIYVTDDLLAVSGRLRFVPSFVLQDDDVTAVPESALLHYFANHLLTPSVADMKNNNHKKISFFGYKELGSLYPTRFSPDINKIRSFNPNNEKYFLLRLVSLKATHDINKTGLNNEDVKKLLSILEKKGKVFISSERALPEIYEKYRINIKPNDISHALYFAELVISDSQTMSAESGVLGTPYIRFNDFVGKLSYLEELENKYKLGFGVKTSEKEKLFEILEQLLNNDKLKEEWLLKKQIMINEKIDLTAFFIWLFENYPKSYKTIKEDINYQLKFK
jgi:hypothetical protein